jgi:tol-pal system protein YbgF
MRGISTLSRLTPLVLGLSMAACGTSAELRAELDDHQSKMRAMADAYESQNRRIESLKGRIEVLEDQVEAAKLHGGAAGRPLPVVKLAPKAPPPDADDREGEGGGLSSEANVEGGDVGYVISQADVDALDSPERAAARRSGGPRGPVPPPENAAFAGNIGVAPLPGSQGAASGGAGGSDPGDEAVATYKAIYAQYKNGEVPAAITGFQKFVERWPEHSYSDNALFLVGQARYDRAELAAALTSFRKVVDAYPAGNKVPDALLMIGLTLDRLGRPAEARETLGRLVSMFPGTEAAARAQATLRGGHM